MGASKGGNFSENRGSFNQEVMPQQTPFLQNLWKQAGNLYNQFNPDFLNDSTRFATDINKGAAEDASGGFRDLLGGGSIGNTDDIRAMLMDQLSTPSSPSQMSQMYESIVGGKGNTYVDPLVDAMKESSMENLARMQSDTALDAAAMGQPGSSRHAMQNAMLSNEVNKNMMETELGMREAAYDKDLQMKMDIARNADQYRYQTESDKRNMLEGLLGSSDANKSTALQFSPYLQNLGMGSMAPDIQKNNSMWDAMRNYAETIGAPVITGSGSYGGSSAGAGKGGSIKG